MRKVIALAMILVLSFSGWANAAEDEIPAKTLSELLELVKEGQLEIRQSDTFAPIQLRKRDENRDTRN